jgi:hypothetical protein
MSLSVYKHLYKVGDPFMGSILTFFSQECQNDNILKKGTMARIKAYRGAKFNSKLVPQSTHWVPPSGHQRASKFENRVLFFERTCESYGATKFQFRQDGSFARNALDMFTMCLFICYLLSEPCTANNIVFLGPSQTLRHKCCAGVSLVKDDRC